MGTSRPTRPLPIRVGRNTMNLQDAVKQATNSYTGRATDRATDQDNESAINKATTPDLDGIAYRELRWCVIQATRQSVNWGTGDSVKESLK